MTVVLCYIVNQVLVRLWARVIDIRSVVARPWVGEDPVVRPNCLTGNCCLAPLEWKHWSQEGSAPTVGGEGSEACEDFVGWIFPRLRKQCGETAI